MWWQNTQMRTRWIWWTRAQPIWQMQGGQILQMWAQRRWPRVWRALQGRHPSLVSGSRRLLGRRARVAGPLWRLERHSLRIWQHVRCARRPSTRKRLANYLECGSGIAAYAVARPSFMWSRSAIRAQLRRLRLGVRPRNPPLKRRAQRRRCFRTLPTGLWRAKLLGGCGWRVCSTAPKAWTSLRRLRSFAQ